MSQSSNFDQVNQIVLQYGVIRDKMNTIRSIQSEEPSERSQPIATQFSSFDRLMKNIDPNPSFRQGLLDYRFEEVKQNHEQNELKSIILSLTKENHKLKQIVAQQRRGDEPTKQVIKNPIYTIPGRVQSKKKSLSFSLRTYDQSGKNSFFDRSPTRKPSKPLEGGGGTQLQQYFIQQNYYLVTNKPQSASESKNGKSYQTNPYLSDSSSYMVDYTKRSIPRKNGTHPNQKRIQLPSTPQKVYIENNYFRQPAKIKQMKILQFLQAQERIKGQQRQKHQIKSYYSSTKYSKQDSDYMNFSH